MSDLDKIMARLHAGARVEIVTSAGRKAVAVNSRWLPKARLYHLGADEITLIEVALQVRRRRGQLDPTS